MTADSRFSFVPGHSRWSCVALTFSALLLQGCGTGLSTAQAGISTAGASTAVVASSIAITHGGTYSGTWNSDDPTVPAISITTDEPVVIANSRVSGRGDLIYIRGRSGANVTVRNVTGTGQDPQIAGKQRGSFVWAGVVSSLVVDHCTMVGTRHGVLVTNSQPTVIRIVGNKATNLEDRVSDGAGGFMTARPDLGHFIHFHEVAAAQGAEIAWNQLMQTMGQSSIEDGINIYKSQGSASAPIYVHDNYIEGDSSPATNLYSGNGVIADGDSSSLVTAYVRFEANEIVHTAGGGVMIANGHDIMAIANRVVSCGKDAGGKWYARKQVTAVGIWNYYSAPYFFNNLVTSTAGGMVVPDGNGTAVVSNTFAIPSDLLPNNSISGNLFTNPCFQVGSLELQAEQDERAYWGSKLNSQAEAPGDPRVQ